MSKIKAKELLQKYKGGTCTEEEKALIETWYNSHGVNNPSLLSESEREHDVKEIGKFLNIESRNPVKLWPGVAAAAIILATLSIGFFFLSKPEANHQESVQKVEPLHDITPGGNKAFLTLADGTRISLDDAANGEIAKQAGIIISKTADGQIVYTTAATSLDQGSLPVYNTIETPKGGQYQVNLPDGSKVWLNAASSLHYPAVFNGNQRKVELTGEAYFEIAVDKKKPFIVSTVKQEVEVLGTHFNINSYADEPAIRTTLLEGSVKIVQLGTSNSQLLAPGQQAVLTKKIQVISADTEEALAWKNGYFMFNDESLESIMRKVSRWYNIEVEYQDHQVNQEVFAGTISRSGNVSKVLKMIEITGDVSFKILPGDALGKGRKIIVTSE